MRYEQARHEDGDIRTVSHPRRRSRSPYPQHAWMIARYADLRNVALYFLHYAISGVGALDIAFSTKIDATSSVYFEWFVCYSQPTQMVASAGSIGAAMVPLRTACSSAASCAAFIAASIALSFSSSVISSVMIFDAFMSRPFSSLLIVLMFHNTLYVAF